MAEQQRRPQISGEGGIWGPLVRISIGAVIVLVGAYVVSRLKNQKAARKRAERLDQLEKLVLEARQQKSNQSA